LSHHSSSLIGASFGVQKLKNEQFSFGAPVRLEESNKPEKHTEVLQQTNDIMLSVPFADIRLRLVAFFSLSIAFLLSSTILYTCMRMFNSSDETYTPGLRWTSLDGVVSQPWEFALYF